ncbi:MAG: response regulator [Pseudomonadota bacterium]
MSHDTTPGRLAETVDPARGWRIRLLDEAQVLDPEGRTAAPARKGMALLAYLAVQPARAARRDVLAALLWENVDLPQGRISLRQALLRLRKLAPGGEGLLAIDGDLVRLAPDVEVDTAAFEALGQGDATARREAVELYRTDLMGGFALRDAPAFNEWLAIEQARLRQRAVGLFQDLLEEALTEPADLAGAVGLALRLVALDPFNEAAHRSLMTAYARQGRTALALSQFRSLTQLLRSQLQVAPEVATVQLYEKLRRSRLRPAGAEASAPEAEPPEADARPAGGRRPHVVVVDDEADLRESVATYMKLHDLDATEAGCGAELDAVLAVRAADVVLLDVSMPGEDGLSIARRLSEQGGMGIIMLTARGEVVDRIVGLEVGADDYLSKPFELRELLARVRALLRRTAGR